MSKETEAHLKRIGQMLAIVLGVLTLTAAARAGMESWLWTRREQDTLAAEIRVWLVKDSIHKQSVARFIAAQNCKEYCAANPKDRPCGCLRADRP